MDVYARLSFAPNGDRINVDDQVEWCSEAIGQRGGVLGRVFRDDSKSAWNPKVVRRDWERLMQRLEAGESDGVMVLDVTRFSRKVMEGERLLELAKRGVRVWSVAGSYELTTADGRRHFREAMVAAAGESDKISERVRRGKARKARRGRPPGGTRGFGMPGWLPAPAGWEPGEPREPVPAERVEAERDVVREVYRRLLAGESLGRLVRELNTRGVRTVASGRWSGTTLARMLCRPALAGLREHNGEIVGTLLGVDPVVSREEWERMCGLFAARKRGRPGGQRHLLSGLLHCGRCGARMVGVPRAQLAPYADGEQRRHYRCRWQGDASVADPGSRGCGHNGIDARVIEAAVAEAVKIRLGDPRRAERVAKRLAQVSAQRAEITAEIHRLEDSADTLAGKVAEWGMERVDKAMAPILRRVQILRGQLDELALPEEAGIAAADVARLWDEADQRNDIDTLRLMVRRAFPHLTVRPPAHRGDHTPDRIDFDGTTCERSRYSRGLRSGNSAGGGSWCCSTRWSASCRL